MRRHIAWGFACGLWLHAAAAYAEGTSAEGHAAAQALFDDARRLMSEGKAAEACPKLEESQRLDPGVGTQFNLAACYEAIGRTASAWSLYLEVAAAARSAAEQAREQAARTRAAKLEGRLSRLRIVVPEHARAPGLRIERGSVSVGPGQWDVPLPTDPGTYTISASAPGKKPWTVQVTVPDSGETATLTLGPLPDAPTQAKRAAEPSRASWFASLGTQRVLALGLGAGAVIALGVGSFFGLQALHENDASKRDCIGNSCTDAGLTRRNDARASGNVATLGFVTGGALAVAGTALFLTGKGRDTAEPRASLVPMIAVDGAALLATGSF